MSGVRDRGWIKRVAAVVFIAVSVWWGLYLPSPPSPRPAEAPETEFSAERAFDHVRAIAQQPHLLGTAAHDSVRNYILEELVNLGVDSRIEEGISTVNFHGYRAARTQNIIARVEGTDPENTIMLMAHYDSVPYSPGAADDASGVAAILELLQAVKAGEPLKNNLLMLLTDGEELGMMGARQFVSSNDRLDEIDLILNFEARGSSGSSVMFETNNGNAELIPLFAKFTPSPVANSLTYSVYKILPNDTDFSVFKLYDLQGLNFAFIEDYLNYHTMQDSPENISMASLQHHGENLLGNVRGFGNQRFDLVANSDLIYFNNPLGGLTFYPESWASWLAGITVLILLLTLWAGIRNRWFSIKGILSGLLIYLGITIFSGLITWYGWDLIQQYIFPEYQWQQHRETYAYGWYLWFFISVITLISLPILRWTKHKVNIHNLLAGIYLTSVFLLITLTIFLPGGNYLLQWPVFFGLIGWMFAGNQLQAEKIGWRTLAILSVSLFMLLFIVPFYIKLIQVTLTTQLLVISLLLYILMLGLLYPLLDYIIEGASRLFYAFIAITVLVCFSGAALHSYYSTHQKKQNSLIYATHQETAESYWLSIDHATDEWTSQFLGEQPADSSFPDFQNIRADRLLYSSAPRLDIDSPVVKLLQDDRTDSLRSVTLQFRHTHPARATSISFSDTSRIRKVKLEGKEVYNKRQPVDEQTISLSELTYYQDMRKPFSLHISLPADTEAPDMKITSYNLRLPDTLMQNYSGRGPHMMPKPMGFTNGTIWTKKVNIDDL